MRKNLKNARNKANMTQKDVADMVHIGLRHYKALEAGERLGAIDIWDALELLFSTHQKVLREISEIHHDTKENQ